MDRVADAIREVSAEAVEPRFGSLTAGQVRDKAPGEVVTAADEEAERLLTRRLRALLEAPVVGEEAVTADPGRMAGLGAERAWVVDPLDGTANFVAGSPDWAVMVALLARGETVAAWIWRPVDGVMYRAERGGGAERAGPGRATDRLRLPSGADSAGAGADPGRLRGAVERADPADLRGAVLSRFLTPAQRAHVERRSAAFGAVTAGRMCAGVDHPLVAEAAQDFVAFHRTLPWDHAPGVLLVQEAGGVASRLDGTPYRPGDDRSGLLAAVGAPVWETVRSRLLLPGRP